MHVNMSVSGSEHYPRLWDPQKKTLEAWPSWLIENRAWLYLAAYIRRKKPSVCGFFNLNKLISATYHIELVHVLTIGWNEKLMKLYKLRMTLFRYNKKNHTCKQRTIVIIKRDICVKATASIFYDRQIPSGLAYQFIWSLCTFLIYLSFSNNIQV